jgi:hypothetical protein
MTTDQTTPVTWDTDATAMPGPMTVVHPERLVTDAELADVAPDSGVNVPFLADVVASCATHERMGLNLFKALEAQTDNPGAKRRFAQFQDDAITAVATYDLLMERLGIPVHYASRPARMTEALDAKIVSAFLLSGSVDQLTVELKGIEAVMLAATMCVANAALLRSIGESMDEGTSRDAVLEACQALEPAAVEHLEWAAGMQQELVLAQTRSGLAQKAAEAAEAVVGKVRDVIGRT